MDGNLIEDEAESHNHNHSHSSPLFNFARKLAKDKGHNYALKYVPLGEAFSVKIFHASINCAK